MEGALDQLGPGITRQILEAITLDPDTIHLVVNDIPAASEPVSDYITDLDERCKLFHELEQLLMYDWGSLLNATMFAFVMVAPIPEIRRFLSTIFPENSVPLLVVSSIAHITLRNYLSRDFYIKSPGSPAVAPRTESHGAAGSRTSDEVMARNATMSELVKERDGNACVFSGVGDPEAAFIFPLAAIAGKRYRAFDQVLPAFWGAEKAMAWRRQYEDGGVNQSAKNGISMSHQIRFWLDNGRFALKPLRRTEDGIVVQWHWLKRAILKPMVWIKPGQDILLQAGLTDQNWGESLLTHRRSGVPIRTGQTFTIRAENPEDLPSWDLLDMHWNMLRVAAISGAADVADDYYDQDIETGGEDEVVTARQEAVLAQRDMENAQDCAGSANRPASAQNVPSAGPEPQRRKLRDVWAALKGCFCRRSEGSKQAPSTAKPSHMSASEAEGSYQPL